MPRKQGPRLFWRLSNTQHPKSDLQQTLADHPLNHALQILLPTNSTDPAFQSALEEELSSLFAEDDACFQVLQESLGDVVEHILVSGLLAQAGVSLQAISLTERLDTAHSGIAITPDGSLHLALDRQAYQRLGLVGAGSRADAERYNLMVDLKAESLQPGGRRHQELVDKLRAGMGRQALLLRLERNGRREDFGLPRAPSDVTATSASMALEVQDTRVEGLLLPPHLARGLFELQRGATATAAGSQQQQGEPQGAAGSRQAAGQQHDGMDVGGDEGEVQQQPQQQGPQPQQVNHAEAQAQLQALIQDMHAWLAALTCGLDRATCNSLVPGACIADGLGAQPRGQHQQQQQQDDHLGAWAAGTTGTLVGRTWKGLLSQQQVRSGLRLAGQLVAMGRCSWALVSAWGFADSPAVAGQGSGAEHGPEAGMGSHPLESHYSVLLLGNKDYCLFRPMGGGERQGRA